MSAPQRGLTRPGGRTERVRKAVVTAVLRRLGAGDLTFSFQDIATDAGVHIATVYARWPSRDALMTASLDEHVRKLTFHVSGDWESDLLGIGMALRNFLSDPMEIASNKLMVTSGSAEYREQVIRHFETVTDEMAAPIDAAKQRGLVRKDADSKLIINMIISTILSQIIFSQHTPDDAEITRIIDHVIYAVRI